MTTARSIRLKSRPEGAATEENFELASETLPEPKDGEILVRVGWLSLDPYMRGRMSAAKSYADPVEIGGVMTAQCVARVIASKNPDFAEGDIVMGGFGWADHAISDGAGVMKVPAGPAPQPALSVLGMTGFTAWVGLNEIAHAKPGETALISSATGAVGTMAGQLAKAKGMTVIGVAGGAEKCAYAVDELGYDHCLDHRANDAKSLAAAVAEAAPQGIDVYFENVGGDTLTAAVLNMNDHGRIALCGMVAWYQGKNVENAAPLPLIWQTLLTRKLTAQGFIVGDHYGRYGEFHKEVAPMVADGRIAYREDVTEGLENAPAAFLRLLDGANFGKVLVKVSDL